MIDSDSSIPEAYTEEEAFKAVVVGPRKFDMALGDKDWSDAARTELDCHHSNQNNSRSG